MQDARTRLEAILRERIAVLDGSWGVLIQRQVKGEEAYRGERFEDHPRDVAGDPDLLNLTRPEVVLDIHHQYFAAGADIATTNTFTATSIGQADYALEAHVREMNLEGARLARQAADEVGGFVAGSVGPLNVTLSLSPRVDDPAFRTHTFTQVRDAYAEQIRALADGGVDFLLIETIFDTLNAKAAIMAAIDTAPELPLWISFTAIDKSGRNLSGQTVDAFWLSVEHANPFIVGVNCSLGATQMRPFVEDLARVAPTWVACHPNAGLPNEFGAHDERPQDTSRFLREFAQDGLVNLVGTEPEVARIPIMVDSSRWSVLEAGLTCLQGKGVVNSISLKEGEEPFLEQARRIKRYGAGVVVMAFDEQGQADTAERKVSICERAYRLLTEEADFAPEDLIFDPNILAVATGIEEHDLYAKNFIDAL